MIPHDLTQCIKVSLKTATGQLGYILSKIDDVDPYWPDFDALPGLNAGSSPIARFEIRKIAIPVD